jgi:hypothetical protein
MTIKPVANYYVLTTPSGFSIKCHNRATAEWYARVMKPAKPT